MSYEFELQWNKYVSLFWQNVYSQIDNKDIFPKENIILWGWVPYVVFEKSKLLKTNTLFVNNKELKVYFYLRKLITESKKIKLFVFVNIVAMKHLVEHSKETDHIFLRELYHAELNIHELFNHKYSNNCWETLKSMEDLN